MKEVAKCMNFRASKTDCVHKGDYGLDGDLVNFLSSTLSDLVKDLLFTMAYSLDYSCSCLLLDQGCHLIPRSAPYSLEDSS